MFLALEGSGRWKKKPIFSGKSPEPGVIFIPTNSTSDDDFIPITDERELGVTAKDLVKQLDNGNRLGGAFSDIKFTKSEVEKCINNLEESGLYKEEGIHRIERRDGGPPDEIGIKIAEISDDNKNLHEFVTNCVCMIGYVQDRIEYDWSYKRAPTRNSEELKWYMLTFGPVRTKKIIIQAQKSHLHLRNKKNEEKKLYKMKYGEDTIKMFDEAIIALYHNYIICDKYADDIHKKYRNSYDKYRNFVRDTIPKKDYDVVLDGLKDLVYPLFLRRIHEDDPAMVQFTKGLLSCPAEEVGPLITMSS